MDPLLDSKDYEVSIEEAGAIVKRAINAQCGPCELCERQPIDETKPISQMVEMVDAGWELEYARAGYFKRCEPCKTPRFPWAKRLDVERVRAYVEGVYERNGGPTVFLISDMEHLV